MKILTLRLGILAGLLVVPLAACNTSEPCEVRPTRMVTEADGDQLCLEADDEVCDDDPCDAEVDTVKWKPKKSTTRRR